MKMLMLNMLFRQLYKWQEPMCYTFHFIGLNIMFMIRLLSFAVIHSKMTGLTLIELLTKTQADHWNLFRTHVWGSPTFVPDPQLQNGEKNPK